MIKQLITIATFLLIQNILKIIHYVAGIFDFTIFAQYLSHNNLTLSYMEHTLYRFDKTKIMFENHSPINAKLFQPTFNYPKLYTIRHFVHCIWNYGNLINYDKVYNEAAHKYFFKAFYERNGKKKYELQILEYNICHINIIAMQNAILKAKVLLKSPTKKEFIINMFDVKITEVYNAINVLLKYNWHMNFTDNEAAMDLGLQSDEKYRSRAA